MEPAKRRQSAGVPQRRIAAHKAVVPDQAGMNIGKPKVVCASLNQLRQHTLPELSLFNKEQEQRQAQPPLT